MSIDIIDTFNSNDGTEYIISKGMMTFSFALKENPHCFIEFTIENINLLKIDLFKCSSVPGTGRVLMYNLFVYLIYNNVITPKTKVTIFPSADLFEIERIPIPDQRKLVKYYNKLGFDKNETIHKEGVVTLSGIVDAIMWNIEYYHNRTIIDHDKENQFYSTGGKRSKSKRMKSKRMKSKRKKSKRMKSK